MTDFAKTFLHAAARQHFFLQLKLREHRIKTIEQLMKLENFPSDC
jgi:hypothetical protein